MDYNGFRPSDFSDAELRGLSVAPANNGLLRDIRSLRR
jgi:hypothetical protein